MSDKQRREFDRAIEQMKSGNVLIVPQADPERPEDFLAAEQFLVALGALGIASLMAHHVTPAVLSDWRLWLLGATSLGAGLIGTRIMLRAEPSSVTFPAYSNRPRHSTVGIVYKRAV